MRIQAKRRPPSRRHIHAATDAAESFDDKPPVMSADIGRQTDSGLDDLRLSAHVPVPHAHTLETHAHADISSDHDNSVSRPPATQPRSAPVKPGVLSSSVGGVTVTHADTDIMSSAVSSDSVSRPAAAQPHSTAVTAGVLSSSVGGVTVTHADTDIMSSAVSSSRPAAAQPHSTAVTAGVSTDVIDDVDDIFADSSLFATCKYFSAFN